METKITQKIPKKFYCDICDYYTCNKKDFNKHNSTLKHVKNHKNFQSQQMETILPHISPFSFLSCENCDRKYKDRSGLWKHKKKCDQSYKKDDINSDKEIIRMLIKENAEFKKQVLEICKNIQPPTIISHNNTTNTTNKTFKI